MLFIFVSFLAGILTVLAPCVLPVLPVIIGGAVSEGGNRHKAITIIVSLVLSIILFTLLLKYSTAFIMVPALFWQILSGGIIIFVSLVMIFPGIWESIPFVGALSRGSNKVLGVGYQKKSFWGDVIIGASLGPVFSSCSPTYFVILATVLPQSFGRGLLDLGAYALGLGIMLLLISRIGQRIIDRLGNASNPNGWVKRTIGILFLLVGIFIISGQDKVVQSYVLKHWFDVTKVEQRILQNTSQN